MITYNNWKQMILAIRVYYTNSLMESHTHCPYSCRIGLLFKIVKITIIACKIKEDRCRKGSFTNTHADSGDFIWP